ncbi:MAG: guanylate kinase [Chloroflexi bacterium]|nr:MAG: guanylate kinase [Chloroflexota bacterium]RLC80255.1 MAG: guanylate kinase [Chloroflexota bacterium]HEY72813.1 guanylate kinase [Thermoflexia bacterium]
MKEPTLYQFERSSLLIVISGPAGVGKDAVLQCLQERGCPFHFVVTATDRPPRPGEVHGVDYFFLTTDEFAEMVEQDELLEHAIVYGQYKGIPKQQVREALASGKDVIMRIDVQGAATIRRLAPEAVLIFLTASSEEELEQRLRARGGDSSAQLQKRIVTAREEMMRLPEFDYVVVNRDGELDQAVDDVLAIIQTEHCRVEPRVVRL